MNVEYGSRVNGFIKGEVSKLDVRESLKLGFAIGEAIKNGRVGIGYSNDIASRVNALTIMSALSAENINVWDFKETFLSELSFLVKFSALQAGIFVDSKRGSIIILGSDGIRVPHSLKEKIENNLYSHMIPTDNYSNIFDMSPLNGLYLKELQNSCDFKKIDCTVKSSNKRIEMILGDVVGQKENSDLVLRVNKFGTGVSAYHKEIGLIPFNKILLICENYNKNEDNNGNLKLFKKELWRTDALFTAIKLLSIIKSENTDIVSLYMSEPECYIKRKVVETAISKDFCDLLKSKGYDVKRENDDVLKLSGEQGTASVVPLSEGKTGVLARCANMEAAKEFTLEIENLLQKS